MKLPKWLTTVTPISKALAMIIFIVFPILGFNFGYRYGLVINQINYSNETNVKTNQVLLSPTPVTKIESSFNLSYEFLPGYTFNLQYPIDADISIINQDSRFPISQMQALLYKGLNFYTSSNSSSKEKYNIYVGLSDVDPTVCYKTTCKDVLESINKIENVNINGIEAKRVEGTSRGGGGIYIPPPPNVVLYIIPYLDKFLILHSQNGEGKIFDEMVSSFSINNFFK